jgi:hypothetical protein
MQIRLNAGEVLRGDKEVYDPRPRKHKFFDDGVGKKSSFRSANRFLIA